MTLSERVKITREHLGWSQSVLAEKSGISQQMIAKLEKNPEADTTYILELAQALKVSPYWLKFGIEEKDFISQATLKRLPIISEDDLKRWGKDAINKINKEVCEMVMLHENVSDSAFAYKLLDDSMAAPPGSEDTFARNDIIIIDPFLRAEVDDFVLAIYKPNNKIFFRKYIEDTGFCLQALNPSFRSHIFDDNYEIIGVMRFKIRKYR